MACDSRWSISYGPWFFYLDDSGYEKIERYNNVALMFAGDGRKIQEFKDWIASDPVDSSSMPAEKGMSVCMVDEATGKVMFEKHQDINSDNVLCAGSGALWAFGCWKDNKCSKQAVKTAIQKDFCSGGAVKYIDFAKPDTNLLPIPGAAKLHIDAVTNNILTRGNVMKIQATPTGVPNLPLPKAEGASAANDEQIARAEAARLAANGQLSATAPCAGMHNEWSDQDRSAFKEALGKMFGWSN